MANVLLGIFVLANAWAAGPSPSGIEACPRITDAKQRLACFDREFALQQQPRDAGARNRTERSAPARTVLTPEQRMGLTPDRILKLQSSNETRELKELTAKIEAVAGGPAARRSFTLENGQVWRQVEADPDFMVRPGDTVRITRAMFGSYFMSVSRHMNTRVSRAR